MGKNNKVKNEVLQVDCKKIAKIVFEDHGGVQTCYITSDGSAFINRNSAEFHARINGLELHEVKRETKEDVNTESNN
jgi:hypothetical protein